MDHLVCFVPGMLALGSMFVGESGPYHLKLAESLAEGCYFLYHQQKTKIGPERVKIVMDEDQGEDI